jgi:hypothetical protein
LFFNCRYNALKSPILLPKITSMGLFTPQATAIELLDAKKKGGDKELI